MPASRRWPAIPSVLKWMDDNLNWTTQLGQAFLNQQQDVMDSIQRLRATASNLGNLQSTPQQQVINDGGDIEIVPADPQVIYVPVYQPDQVYYDAAYGTPFITFGIGWPFGSWLDYDCDWGAGNLIVWGHDHPRPANWWHEPPRQRDMGHTRSGDPTIIPAQSRRTAATGVMAATHTFPCGNVRSAIRQRTGPTRQRSNLSTSVQPSVPRSAAALALNALHPSAGRNRTARSSASRVRTTQELIATAASKACRPVTHSAPVSRPAPSGGELRRRRWRLTVRRSGKGIELSIE